MFLTVGMTLGIRVPVVGPLKDINFQKHSGAPLAVLVYIYIQSGIAWDSMVLDITHCLVQGTVVPLKKCGPHGPRMMAVRHKDSRRMAFP